MYDTIVYSKTRYDQYTRGEAYKLFLRRIFAEESVFAVGFGFADPPFLDVLRFIGDDLGGHTSRSHLAILPTSSGCDKTALARAAFELILYDDNDGHDYVRHCLRELRQPDGASTTRTRATGLSGNDQEYAALVSAFLSITNPDRGSTYDTAAAAIVLAELKGTSVDRAAVSERLARRLCVSETVADRLAARGIEYLQEGAQVRTDGTNILLAADMTGNDHCCTQIVDAVCTRMMVLDRTVRRSHGIERAIREGVTHVMMAQGMAAARAFVNTDRPDSYAVQRLVDVAAEAAPIKTHWRRCLAQALREILHEPTPGMSRELFKLANAAFALESVFLNPHGVELGQALRWRMYLDSNVVLRMLDESGLSGTGFKEFHDRLRRLRAPMHLLGPFAEEIVGNVRLVGRQLVAAGALAPDLVEKLCESIPAVERSPVLNWYLWGLRAYRWTSYNEFTARERLDDVASVSKRLAKLGIIVEGHDAVRQYDTSERETLWSELREWRANDADSLKGRRLRRAEATQVMYLSDLRAEGEKAWFVSIDGQLRRALKYVRGGRYAGYVMTPGAWLLRLNTLHWGEIDVSGFSELLWAVPRQTPLERLRAMVMTRVLQAEPDLRGESPDWLRDRVEDEFARIASVVTAQVESSGDDDEEQAVSDLAEQLVEPSAHRILDELVKRREAQGRR